MPGIKKHLKQTATLRRYAGFSDDGSGDLYDPPVGRPPLAIKVRKVPADGRTVNQLGAEVQNRTKILTDAHVSVGDLIDDAAVEGVEAIVDKRGKTIGWRVEL